MKSQQLGPMQVARNIDVKEGILDLVRAGIAQEPAMAAVPLAFYLMRTGDAELIAAYARDLTSAGLARAIRAERAAAGSPPPEAASNDGPQPFLPEYVEQLNQLPPVIENRAGESIQPLKARYGDLRERLKSLKREYWSKRGSVPEIAATESLMQTMLPHWKENREITLEEALRLETEKKRLEGREPV